MSPTVAAAESEVPDKKVQWVEPVLRRLEAGSAEADIDNALPDGLSTFS